MSKGKNNTLLKSVVVIIVIALLVVLSQVDLDKVYENIKNYIQTRK